MTAEEFLAEYNREMEEISKRIDALRDKLEQLDSVNDSRLRELVGDPIGCIFLASGPPKLPGSKGHMSLLIFPELEEQEGVVQPVIPFLLGLFHAVELNHVRTILETVLVSAIWGSKEDPISLGSIVALRVLQNAHVAANFRASEMQKMIRKELENRVNAKDSNGNEGSQPASSEPSDK